MVRTGSERVGTPSTTRTSRGVFASVSRRAGRNQGLAIIPGTSSLGACTTLGSTLVPYGGSREGSSVDRRGSITSPAAEEVRAMSTSTP